jgi:hypothetical protein
LIDCVISNYTKQIWKYVKLVRIVNQLLLEIAGTPHKI